MALNSSRFLLLQSEMNCSSWDKQMDVNLLLRSSEIGEIMEIGILASNKDSTIGNILVVDLFVHIKLLEA